MTQRTAKIIVMVLILLPVGGLLAADSPPTSPYAGQEKRAIKSLSEKDIEELTLGKGWGLAKAAELNGMPGPAHLLEMKAEIGLEVGQISAIEKLYDTMKKAAIPLGLELIKLERALNDHFARRTITEARLNDLLGKIARTHKRLRHVHLAAHLETPAILTPEQIATYNNLRGYTSGDDPCQSIPAGHDPEMWKRHHQCP